MSASQGFRPDPEAISAAGGLRAAALLFVAIACAASAAPMRFVHVWPQWHDADAFKRIHDYFGRSDEHRKGVYRTHEDDVAGLYFLARVKSAERVPGARFVLDVVRPDSPDPKRFVFPAPIPAKGEVVQLGLTGGDWPGGRTAHPVAWKLAVVGPDGRVLASKQSFLWAMPAK